MKLYEKLHSIQEQIDVFVKRKKAQNYSYVDGDQVLNTIRPLMNAAKLILKQEIISIDNTRQDYVTSTGKPKNEVLSKVMMRFTWIDCESGDKDENLFGANGMNDWDKGVGSALTYGERYFLLKTFHVPTDSDDADVLNRQEEKELIWLNVMDKDKNFTAEWDNILKAISSGKITSVADVQKHYLVSKEVQDKIQSLLK